MGYEFICGIPMAVGTALTLVFGFFITLEWLQDWMAKQIKKNARISVKFWKY